MEAILEEQSRKIIGQYRKRKWLGIGILMVGVVYAFYLLLGVSDEKSFLLWVSGYVSFAVIAVIAFLVRASGFAIINKAYEEQCDPFLYEACLDKLHSGLFPDRMLCNRGIAQYYQGNYGTAFETFQHIRRQKLKGTFLNNYYIILSSLYFLQGRGEQTAELENMYQTALKDKKRDRDRMDLLRTSNNLIRAVKNGDYEKAFRFLTHRREMDARSVSTNLSRVVDSMWEARIFLGLGEKQAARLKLEFVIGRGGRLAIVEEARRLLKEC